MGAPPWAMVAGSLLGLDKLVFEPAGNIYKSIQGIRDDSNSSDAMSALAKYQTAKDLESYDPSGEGYMSYDTQQKVAEAKKARLEALQKSEAMPVESALAEVLNNPEFDFSSFRPEDYLATKGIVVDTSNPYTMKALQEIGKRIGLVKGHSSIAKSMMEGKQPNANTLGYLGAENGANLEKATKAYENAGQPWAQSQFNQGQAEIYEKPYKPYEFGAATYRNIAKNPLAGVKPTDASSTINSRRELAEVTPAGALTPYTVGAGRATEAGNMQWFELGAPKVVNNANYTEPKGSSGSGGGSGDKEYKSAKSDQKAKWRAYKKARQVWRKNRDSESQRAMNEAFNEYATASDRVGQNVRPQAGKKAEAPAKAKSTLDRSNPKVKAALDAGYSEQEIAAYLARGK